MRNSSDFTSACISVRSALLLGYRMLELDCWDGAGGEPVVHHQHTLAAHLPLNEALQTILKYAFTNSPYPLILSLNLICTSAQQRAVAQMLRRTFGQHLYLPSQTASCPRHDAVEHHASLPSPQQLMHRILVRGVPGGEAAVAEEQVRGNPLPPAPFRTAARRFLTMCDSD